MKQVKPIGGYFEWEFPTRREFTLHKDAIFLNSGRHALEYILRGLENVTCLYIPYYTCDAVLLPLCRLNIPHIFYSIDERLEMAEDIQLGDNEYLLYANYFGIKDRYVEKVATQYGGHIIIDNAQALFCPAFAEHQIYSPRKFVGMPDGGLAVTSVADYSDTLPQDHSFDRCRHLLKRTELAPSEGYGDFKEISHQIASSPLSGMSEISKRILTSIDLGAIKEQRLKNFKLLHETLAPTNKLGDMLSRSLADAHGNNQITPMVYPYWTEDMELKAKLIREQVFVATYWPNVLEWVNPNSLESELVSNCLAIPCDQRCGEEDVKRIIGHIR